MFLGNPIVPFIPLFIHPFIWSDIIIRAHSFPRAAEFRAEPRNLAVAAEFPYFRGISRNSA